MNSSTGPVPNAKESISHTFFFVCSSVGPFFLEESPPSLVFSWQSSSFSLSQLGLADGDGGRESISDWSPVVNDVTPSQSALSLSGVASLGHPSG